MSAAHITLAQRAFAPGATIEGVVEWALSAPPERAEVRLFWETKGKGTRDVGVESSVTLEAPGAVERRAFAFRAPDAPPSLSGRLIAIVWAIEVVLEPGTVTACEEIVIGPRGHAIDLERAEWLAAPDPQKKSWLKLGP